MPPDTTLNERDKKQRPLCLVIWHTGKGVQAVPCKRKSIRIVFTRRNLCEKKKKRKKILPLDMNWSFSLVAFRILQIYTILYVPVLRNKFRQEPKLGACIKCAGKREIVVFISKRAILNGCCVKVVVDDHGECLNTDQLNSISINNYRVK